MGQKAKTASIPVVLASDQDAIAVTGTFWQTTQPVSAASLPLPALAATSTKQSDGSQKTQIVDGSANVIGATSNALDINIKSGNPTTIAATQATASNLNAQVVGDIASGSADGGNPVKAGGKYNSTLPTFTDGQRTDLQTGSRGALRVELYSPNANQSLRALADNADAIAASATAQGLQVASRNSVFNGTTWDRMSGDTTGINVKAIVGAIPAGTNAIGKLAANSGVDIGDVDVTSVTAGTAATSLGKAEDAAHTTGDTGVMALGVYKATATQLAGTDGDYTTPVFDASGALWTNMNTLLWGENSTYGYIDVNPEGKKTTYSSAITALAPAASATDIFTLKGSGTKTIRVTRIQISGVATTAGAYDVQLIKRSTADTSGTSTTPAVVPHDSNDAAGTAVVNAYTANPTLGTAVGTVQSKKITVSTAAGAIPIVPTEITFELRGEKAIVLRGTTEQLCINLNATTMTGGSLNIDITFTEE